MNELRKQFEALPEIKDMIIREVVFFNNFKNNYDGLRGDYARGAWMAFQEQQKQIDNIKSIVESITPYDMDMDTVRKVGEIKEILK